MTIQQRETHPGAAPASLTLPYLANVLVVQGIIDSATRDLFLQHADAERRALHRLRSSGNLRDGRPAEVTPVDLLVFMAERLGVGIANFGDERIVQALAKHLGIPYRRIDTLELDIEFISSVISQPFARKHLMIPLRAQGTQLEVALADPFDLEGQDSIRRTSVYEIRPVLVTRRDLLKVIREFYGFRSSVIKAERNLAPSFDLGNLEQYVRMKKESEIESSDQYIVDAVEYLLLHAFDLRASDIHLEPKRDRSRVRVRIDAVMHTVQQVPKIVHSAMVSRIKTLARMNIAEKRRPQDGRIKTERDGQEVELRVSTIPVAFGEKVVIRIFNPEITTAKLDGLGFFPRDQEVFESFLAEPHGIILVTGPTGSGKTTTLYSALRILADGETNIVTIEDPIEMVTEEFNQTAVNPAIGLDFAAALRTLLRQDPDIVMVGEIRDLETAENAIQAALTGHLVFSTLHTNDAASSITRLLDLGLEPYKIADTVLGIMAQRLVRMVCPHCARQRPLKPEEAEVLGLRVPEGKVMPVRQGAGCLRCRGTGFLGRSGVFEVMAIDEPIRQLIHDRADSRTVREAARRQGMTSLRECAIRKLAQGVTTFEEVLRVTSER
ncbi:MAG: GspE/PulE family protein [Acidobacteriota bacterium]|jgi:general secretion pathway protein E